MKKNSRADRERRKKLRENANRMALLRKERKREGRCYVCGETAAVSDRTGRVARLCDRHLAMDASRKIPALLAVVIDRKQLPVIPLFFLDELPSV